jgi:hypothetical protein
MWWLTASNRGLDVVRGPTLQMSLFISLFGLLCCLKFAVETRRGYFSYLDRDRYLFFRQLVVHPGWTVRSRLYKAVYVAKVVAAAALVLGFLQWLCLLILVVAFALECSVYFKYHANLFLLVSCASALFAFANHPASMLDYLFTGGTASAYIAQAAVRQGNLLGQFLLMFTLCLIYTTTAIRKMNRSFVRGLPVTCMLGSVLRAAPSRMYADGWYPRWFVRDWILAEPEALARRWRPFMLATIAVELALPVALLFPDTVYWAMGAGLAIHVLFAALFPVTLAHFSGLCIGILCLFPSPEDITSIVGLT